MFEPQRRPMSPGLVVLLLALFLGIQPIGTDLYLPALPALTADFAAPLHQTQLTLTALLLAFGASQLVWGPLSDRWGRRPILLCGLLGFTLAALSSAFAASMPQLIAWRTVQGVAMGAVVMCGRAIVRDLYAPSEGARVMSKALTGLGLLACLAAPLGGWLSEHLGWRAAMGALATFGALALGLLLWRFEETLKAPNPRALQVREMLNIWATILRHPTFWSHALLVTTSYCGLFCFMALSSFVFIQLMGLSKTDYGLLLLSMSVVYILGTVTCRHLLPRLGLRRTVTLSASLTLAGGCAMGLLAQAGVHNTWALMLPYGLYVLAHGINQPCGQTGCVSPFAQSAGAASALNGFIMMVAVFGMGLWLGRTPSGDGTARLLAMTNGVWFWSVLHALVVWTLVQRHGEPRPAPQRVPAPAPPEGKA